MARKKQYEICKKRGHVSDWVAHALDGNENDNYSVCKYCQVEYEWENRIIEILKEIFQNET